MIPLATMQRLVERNATIFYVRAPGYFELFMSRSAATTIAQTRDQLAPLGVPPCTIGSAPAMQFDIWTMQPLEGTLL